MEQRLAGRDISYDASPTDDEDYAPVAYLPSLNSDPAEMIEQADWKSDTHDRLGQALAELDDRSRDIVARRWLAEKKVTLHEFCLLYTSPSPRD